MNQKRIFNPLWFLEVRKRIVESPCCVNIQPFHFKCVWPVFTKFGMDFTHHISSVDEQLIIETYRRFVNGFTYTDMSDSLFT